MRDGPGPCRAVPGQEILQYFTSYGYWGIFGTGLLVLVLISYVCVEFFLVGRKHRFDKPSRIFSYYCGRYLGAFFYWFSILFVLLWFAACMTALGRTTRSNPEAASGGILGGSIFALACMIVGLGSLANIEFVAGTEIPMLVLANEISPVLASGFSLIILAGIFTTAVPLLWTVSQRFFADGTPTFKRLTVVLAAVGTLIGLVLPFSQMVDIVYVINGYVGILLLVMMILRTVLRLVRRRPI